MQSIKATGNSDAAPACQTRRKTATRAFGLAQAPKVLALGLLTAAPAAAATALRMPAFAPAVAHPDLPSTKPYALQEHFLVQPLYHAQPDGEQFEQRLVMLVPENAGPTSPVYMNIGGEQPASRAHVVNAYSWYKDAFDQSPVVVEIEHRGFGASLSRAANQSVPTYVTINETLADAACAMHYLKQSYRGSFVVAGYGYEASLSLMFAAQHPQEIDLVIGSSGLVSYPFTQSDTDKQVQQTLGATYASLVVHAGNLKPQFLLDGTWVEREFLQTVALGVGLFPEQYGRYVPAIRAASDYLPTGALLLVLKGVDAWAANSRAYHWASSRAMRDVPRDVAAAHDLSGRGWAYLQCNELGVFWTGWGYEESLFGADQTADGYRDYCAAMFGLTGPRKPLDIRALAKDLSTPYIAVVGGRDPWRALEGVAADLSARGRFIFGARGSHDPDTTHRTLRLQVRDAMREVLTQKLQQPARQTGVD